MFFLSLQQQSGDFQSRLLLGSSGSMTPLSSLTTPILPPYTPSSYSNYLSGSDTEATPSALRLKPPRKVSSEEKEVYKELRRQSHISAEQKRRGSIKVQGCEMKSIISRF